MQGTWPCSAWRGEGFRGTSRYLWEDMEKTGTRSQIGRYSHNNYQSRLLWSCSHFEKSLKEDVLKRSDLISASWQMCVNARNDSVPSSHL